VDQVTELERLETGVDLEPPGNRSWPGGAFRRRYWSAIGASRPKAARRKAPDDVGKCKAYESVTE
jgi:hypothetical protein